MSAAAAPQFSDRGDQGRRSMSQPERIERALPAKILAGLITLACFGSRAVAADLPTPKAPHAPPPPVFTWTGLYVGMNFGRAWTASRSISATSANVLDTSTLLPAGPWGPASAAGASGVADARLDGYFFGGQAGYNWQFSERFVAGLEADIVGAGVRGGGNFTNVAATALGGASVTSAEFHRSLQYLGTARGRFGFTVTPTLLAYATGGLAFGGLESSVSIKQSLSPSLLVSQGAKGGSFDNLVGWAAGAGIEWAFAQNLSAKIEYLYYDLGSPVLTNAQIRALAFAHVLTGQIHVADATNVSHRINGHILRAGLNYRFDWSRPETSGASATPLFASPRFAPVERPAFSEWRIFVMPYMWAFNINGNATERDQTMGVDVTIIDAIAKSSAMPLAFMGRVEARNGPVSFYGDVAWAQLRFAGSTLKLRSPFADLLLGVHANGRLKMTIGIGEAGGAYELACWKLDGADSYTAFDAYAGLRYWYLAQELSLDLIGAASAQSLGLDDVGGRAIAKSGALQWIDPVVGLRLRHEFAHGNEFQMRGDIGGFGVGSKFSWEVYGGYSHDFEFAGLNLTGTIGYRALSVDYSQTVEGRRNGVNAILHGPITGVSLRF
jgi:opacity protein-like surface antigen